MLDWLSNILTSMERLLGFDFPQPVSEKQHRRNQKQLIQRIVADLSRGNITLQNGHYILEGDIEQLRKSNQSHDFCP